VHGGGACEGIEGANIQGGERLMTQTPLGKLLRVDPKSVWQHEAHEFTPWLSDNLSLLNEALGLEIELTQIEMPVGDFAVDIFGKEVGSGREVIIENQLASTDH